MEAASESTGQNLALRKWKNSRRSLHFLVCCSWIIISQKKDEQGYRHVNIFEFCNSWRINTKSKLTERMGFGKHLFEHEHSVVVQLVVLFVWTSCTLVLDALAELTVSLPTRIPSLVFGEIPFFLGAQCGGSGYFTLPGLSSSVISDLCLLSACAILPKRPCLSWVWLGKRGKHRHGKCFATAYGRQLYLHKHAWSFLQASGIEARKDRKWLTANHKEMKKWFFKKYFLIFSVLIYRVYEKADKENWIATVLIVSVSSQDFSEINIWTNI